MTVKCSRLFFFLAVVFGFTALCGAESRKKEPSPKAETDWSQEINCQCRELPLYDALKMLTEGYGFTFFLDRRLDTETPITFSAEGTPLLSALVELAESAGLEAVSVGDSVLYVGPPGGGGELLLLIAEHRKSEQTRRFIPPKRDGYVIPAELLRDTAKKDGKVWTGLEMMPFDCWRAESLSSMPISEFYSLVLIGYGVDYQLDPEKSEFKPVKIDRNISVTRTWAKEDLSGVDFDAFPGVTVTPIRAEMRGTGPFQEIAKLEYAVSKNRNLRILKEQRTDGTGTAVAGTKKVVSGKIQQGTLRTIADYLEKEMGIRLLLDPSLDAAGITLDTRISCEFKNANPEEALKIIAARLHVDYSFKGSSALLYRNKKK